MESPNLATARKALSTFEVHIGEGHAVQALFEGLDLLDEIVMDATEEAGKARTIGDRYVTVALEHVKDLLATGNATEPELLDANDMMQVIKECRFGETDEVKRISFDTVTQLFDKHYTGYSDQEKERILERMIYERKHKRRT